MSYVKNYDVGNIRLDSPHSHFIYELPLLSFGDIKRTIGLSLVFQSKTTENPFYISQGYKFNLQKRLIFNANGTPESLEEGNGTLLSLNRFTDKFTFNDGSQRILRKIGDGTYVLENPDMSVERFDVNGRIKSVTDKYGERYLTYTYYSGKLDTIAYLNDKILKFTYSAGIGMVEKVQYICANETVCTLNFVYPGSANVTITHYSGVSYYITYLNGNFTAYSTDTGSAYSNDYSHRLTCSIGTTNNRRVMSTSRRIGTKEIEKTTYTFLGLFDTDKFSAVNIADINGIVTRVQYENDKPCYSYEVMGDEDPWYDDIFFDDDEKEDIYKGVVTINKDDISGQQTIEDGIKMEVMGDHNNVWHTLITGTEDIYGYFRISGWIEPNDITSCEIIVEDTFNENIFFKHTLTNLIPEIWNYFSFSCYLSNPGKLIVSSPYGITKMYTRDFRVAFEKGKVYEHREINHYTAKQDVIVIEGSNASNEEILYIDDKLHFYYGDTEITNAITAKDIIKYKINQKYGQFINEIYCEDGKEIISTLSAFKVGYYANDDSTEITKINVEDVAVGQLRINKNKGYLTKINLYSDSDGNEYFASRSYDNGNEIQSIIYDDNFDPVFVTKSDITTEYRRTNGLLTYESITGLYTRTVTYGEDESENLTIRITDEFNNSTTHTLDPVWGAVISVTLPDGTIIDDTYDGDNSAIIEREFGRNSNSITSFDYSGGNLSELSKGTLSYEFAYSADSLSMVKKNNSAIEEHILSDNDKTLKSFYPNEDNAIYSVEQNVDNYGRLLSIAGLLTNTYSINPYYSTSGQYEALNENCGTAHLATSTDITTGKATKFAYKNGRVSRIGVFNSAGAKTDEEIFDYDDLGRPLSHVCKYNYIDDTKSAGIGITYVKDTSDGAPDGRVARSVYAINNAPIIDSNNTYDMFNRLSIKDISIAQQDPHFEKTFTYYKTRISKVEEKSGDTLIGRNTYGYDYLGRIVTDAHYSQSASNYKKYTYDSFGQLIREDNQALDKTFIYSYNGIGNIVSVKEYDYTLNAVPSVSPSSTSFTYGDSAQPDRLTKFGLNNISYNSVGYPVSYGNKRFVWTKGRLTRLYDVVDSGYSADDVRFTYDAYGRRLTKTYTYDPGDDYSGDFLIGSATTYNYDNSGRLIREFCTEEYTESASTNYELTYLYDESGVVGFLYRANGGIFTPYYYHRNLQGDVISIHTVTGTKCVEYAYDAYGNCETVYTTNTVIADNNPIRYRGYYYDRETGFYYLNARYYNPEWRRFISPDSTAYLDPESVNGLNLYAYCGNDPINRCDPTGCGWDVILDIISIGLSTYDLLEDPSWENAGWLALDVALLCIPFIPAVSKLAKGASNIDNVLDVANGFTKIDNIQDAIVIGNNMDRVNGVAKIQDAISYSGYTPINMLIDAGKASEITLSMKLLGRIDNVKWLLDKVWNGYHILDVGKDNRTYFKMFLSAYGMERRMLFYWRNFGKIRFLGYFLSKFLKG